MSSHVPSCRNTFLEMKSLRCQVSQLASLFKKRIVAGKGKKLFNRIELVIAINHALHAQLVCQCLDFHDRKHCQPRACNLEGSRGDREADRIFEIPSVEITINESGREGRARARTIYSPDLRSMHSHDLISLHNKTALTRHRNDGGCDPGLKQFSCNRKHGSLPTKLRGIGDSLTDRDATRVFPQEVWSPVSMLKIEKDRHIQTVGLFDRTQNVIAIIPIHVQQFSIFNERQISGIQGA